MKPTALGVASSGLPSRKALSWALALVLFLTCNMPSLAFAAGEGSLQAASITTQADGDTFADEDTRSGDGSESNPYQISTLADLNKLSELISDTDQYTSFNTKSYVLEADIDIVGTWVPIGKAASASILASSKNLFSGTFDGQYHTITFGSSENAIQADSKCYALFGAAANATIENLKTAGAITSSKGILAGVVAVAGNTTIKNVANYANITSTDSSSSSGGTVGGIVGSAASAIDANSLISCCNKGAITCAYNNVGGLVGANTTKPPVLQSCYNIGTVTSSKSDATYVGGITGNGTPKVLNSYNYGNVVVEGAAADYVNSGAIAGYSSTPAGSFVPASANDASYYYDGSVKDGADLGTRGKAGGESAQATYYISKTQDEMKVLESLLNVAETDYAERWISGTGVNESGTPALAWEAPQNGALYEITCTAVQNGSVSLSAMSSAANSQITITTLPSIGYQLDEITAVDANGNNVAISDDGTFTMPAANVTVSATFKVDPTIDTAAKTVYVELVGAQDAIQNGAAYVFTAPDDETGSAMGTDGLTVGARTVAIDASKGTVAFESAAAALGSQWVATVADESLSFESANGRGLNLTARYGLRLADDDITATQLLWKNAGLRAQAPEGVDSGSELTNHYGWLAVVNGAFAMTVSDNATAPATKVKVWKVVQPTYYSVTFDSDGAGDVATQSVLKNDAASEPEALSRDGYVFKGWMSGDQLYDFSAPVTDNVALKAKWVQKDTAAANDVEDLANNSTTTNAELIAAYDELSDAAKAQVGGEVAAKVIAAKEEVAKEAAAKSAEEVASANKAAEEAKAQTQTAKQEAEAAKQATETAQSEAAAAKTEVSQLKAAADAIQKALDEAKAAQAAAEKQAAEAKKQAESAKSTQTKKATAIDKAKVTVAKATYNGKAQKPKVTVKLGSKTLKANTDYTVSYVNNKKAGSAVAMVIGKGSYAGTVAKSFTIAKAKNTLSAAAKSKTLSVKLAKVKKKAQSFAKTKVFKVSKAQGKVTFKKTSGNKKITVTSAGKVSIAKGLKAGTYTVKVKVSAAGNANYKAASKTVAFKVKVK